MNQDIWNARIDVVIDRQDKEYWLMLRLRNRAGEETKHISIQVPKEALNDALENVVNLEKAGYRERSVEELSSDAKSDDEP